ncbi:MAG: sigma-54-dependent Fis family transcriptional regulator [Magnetococcales bacterium]|nr:sigma-54-dependent Fis family transcriptional regulator [Magnetococcales bacterium]
MNIQEPANLPHEHDQTQTPHGGHRVLVGSGPAFLNLLHLIHCAARQSFPILLLGESGTGKELVAQAIHEISDHGSGPFVPVECSCLVADLLESELFGHKRGAFTGAVNDKKGLLEAAQGGTLFLDEIGETPLAMQVKLLRMLEEQTFRQVGDIRLRRVDCRIICATNRDLQAGVAEGSFRQDLYYRITAFPITLPPLRRRREDIPIIVESLLERITGGAFYRVSAEAMGQLMAYAFPGNIRELQNLLERACALSTENVLLPEHFPNLVADLPTERDNNHSVFHPCQALQEGVLIPLAELEKRYLCYALETHQGSREALAQRLGLGVRTLFRKLKELGVAPSNHPN